MKLRKKQQLFPVLDSFNTAHLTEVLPRYLTMLTWYGTWYNGTWYQVPYQLLYRYTRSTISQRRAWDRYWYWYYLLALNLSSRTVNPVLLSSPVRFATYLFQPAFLKMTPIITSGQLCRWPFRRQRNWNCMDRSEIGVYHHQNHPVMGKHNSVTVVYH